MPDPASLLVVNGRVFRGSAPGQRRPHGSDEGPRPEGAPTAVAIVGERIEAVGMDQELRDRRGPRTEIIDAEGGLVLAGFDDAHIHFRQGALSLLGVDLSGCRSVDEMVATIRDYAEANPDRSWIMGRGWFYAPFGDGLPTKETLDRAVPDRPAFMDCYDSHTGWANSKGLEAARIDRETPDPTGGLIVRDPDTGEPTGALKEEAAMALVERIAPQPSDEEKLDALVEASHRYAACGLTAAQDAWSTPEEFGLYERLQARGPLDARFRLALRMEPRLEPAAWERTLEEYEAVAFPRRDDPWLIGGIVKGFVDGVVEARTAAMLEPYEDGGQGLPNWNRDELCEAVAVAHRRGWQVELHAIGDGGVRMALDAYEALGPSAAARRHRIEHIETIDPADIPRFGRLGVVASMQPLHADPAPAELGLFVGAIGARRERTAWPWRSIERAGGVVAFGSDWPVVPFDPFLHLHSAVNRQTADGFPMGGWIPEERLSLPDALSAYTLGGAYAAHADRRGVITPTGWADLAILDRDLLAEGAAAILGTRVRVTIVAGRIVHGG